MNALLVFWKQTRIDYWFVFPNKSVINRKLIAISNILGALVVFLLAITSGTNMMKANAISESAYPEKRPSWLERDFSHMSGPGRWYANELVAMARHALKASMPILNAQVLMGKPLGLYLYAQPASYGNWGDVVLLGKDDPAPKGFSLVSKAPVITGATPYADMVSVLTDRHLNSLPVLPGIKSPYVPLSERGRGEVVGMVSNENNEAWTVSFREANAPYLRARKDGTVVVLKSGAQSGYVVQKEGSSQMSSGEDSFWYIGTEEGKNLAMRMASVLAAGQDRDSAHDQHEDDEAPSNSPGM